ncbi:hypothetical protein NY588_04935 [Curtobacterium flaccumfaciens pv. beticola]|uniref:Uncharacterized protein n=1 Tax=Curtobacterium citreum TaxID=2036 RepID=A0A850DY29_9MICO|nr:MULTISPECIES: hypothetical protein [Curtobacterium]MCS5486479.1 hypothetical protein [Curtobacterium flaccumfaciens pv. basellae]MDK8171465.1 hypothetical protein [Curtobacterium citreum]NUU29328.1 hypothetical protein [Curtobacterium albidum]
MNKNAPVQRSPSANGYIYAQRWNSAFRTPDPRGFLSVEECEARWSGVQADASLGWFTVVPEEPGVGTFRRAADGSFLPDEASAVPTWTMEVIPSGGIAAMGPAFEFSFWDAFNREYASATLANFWDGRPFLQDLAIRSYIDPALFPKKERSRGNVPVLINHFSWKPEGRGQRLRTDLVREEKTREQFADVDVSDNWFQPPGFGEWGTLASAVLAKLPPDVLSRRLSGPP